MLLSFSPRGTCGRCKACAFCITSCWIFQGRRWCRAGIKIKMLDISRHDILNSWLNGNFFLRKVSGITDFCQEWQEPAFSLVFFRVVIGCKLVNSNVTCRALSVGPGLKRHMKCWKQWMNSGRNCRRPEVVLRCSYDLQPSSNIRNMTFCVIP